jgi:hypothetical protein
LVISACSTVMSLTPRPPPQRCSCRERHARPPGLMNRRSESHASLAGCDAERRPSNSRLERTNWRSPLNSCYVGRTTSCHGSTSRTVGA